MLRVVKLSLFAIALTGLTGLSGCAESIYPSLPSLVGNGNNNTNTSSTLLTPAERDKTIQEMTAEQKTHGAAAANEIARRN